VHFRLNWRRIVEYPALRDDTRELYQWPGVAETVAMHQIKTHYDTTHDELNPSASSRSAPHRTSGCRTPAPRAITKRDRVAAAQEYGHGSGPRWGGQAPKEVTMNVDTDYRLSAGRHSSPEEGRCAMEWVSYLAGEPHSDEPACVSPVLRAFCISFNDDLDDGTRQGLRPYLARTIGTSRDGRDAERAWMAMDWLVRVHTPAWLELASLATPATRLRELDPIVGHDELVAAHEALLVARADARTAWSAGRSVAWTIAWSAGRLTAREIGWASAAAAAWASARIGVGDILGVRVRAAARATAGDAAGAYVRGTCGRVTRSAAREASRTALRPTVLELQRGGFELLERMLPTVALEVPTAPDAEAVGALA
jgi:hypothetical protein